MSYKKLGINKNAFSNDAKKTMDDLIRNEEEADNLIYWVESESMILIQGPNASGKTRLAMEVIEEFRGEGKIIYIDLNTYNKELDIAHLLIGNQSFYRKLLNKMPKEMILIIDNAHTLETDFYKRIQYFYDQGYIKSAIIIQQAGTRLELPESIKSRVGNKIITLKEMTKKEAIQLVNERLNDFIKKEQLEQIWDKKPGLNNFLENCEKIISAYIEEDRQRLDTKFIQKVLKWHGIKNSDLNTTQYV